MEKLSKGVSAALLAALLSGCVPSGRVYGPNPVLQAKEVSRSTDNYVQVRDELVRRAGYARDATSVDWYEVAIAGFRYVDEQCDMYLTDLYKIRRERDHLKSQLSAVGTTAGSVLAIAGTASAPIAYTAAAFGLASQINDNASAALLFAMDPTDLDVMLKSQKNAYKNGVAAQRNNYRSSNAAMEAVGGYLNLCLPISIEAQIKAAIQNTVYVATPSNFGAPGLSRVQNSSPAVPVPSVKELRQDKNRVRPTKPSPDDVALNIVSGDLSITREQASQMQKRLCVSADGDLGKIPNTGKVSSATRLALGVVQTEKLKRAPTYRLDEATWDAANALPLCDSTIHLNVFEHITLPDAAAVAKVQDRLKATITEDASYSQAEKDLVTASDFVRGDRLTSHNRDAVKAVQRRLSVEVSGQYGPAVADAITP